MKRMLNFLITEIKLLRVCFLLKKKISSFKSSKNEPIILFEFNNYAAAQIGGYYFISNLLKIKNFDIKCFYNGYAIKSPFIRSFSNSLKWTFKKFFSLGFIKVYKKIYGISNMVTPSIEYSDTSLTNKIYRNLKKKINSKEDVLKIRVNNILVGDLIYDTYIKRYAKPTIDIDNKKFHLLLKECVGLTLYWHDYFQNNKVEYIIGTHGVYSYAIPFRVGLKFKARGFLVNLHGIKEVKNNFLYEHDLHRTKKKLLDNFTKIEKIQNYKKSKKILEKTISGSEIKDKDSTLEISAFSNKKYKIRQIKQSNKLKILISPHDFYDAAHGYGEHKLFTDYYEWLKYTFKISQDTDYEWYLKTHPDLKGHFGLQQRNTRKIINEMLENHKKIKILPPNYSHKQIISEGIDFVITCHGSIAYEYSLNNIPAIIASKCNPYEEFKFTINPKNKKDYKKKIMNLSKIKKTFKINKINIYDWYVLKFFVSNTLSWIFNYKDYCKYMDGWYKWQDSKIFYYWMSKKNNRMEKKIYKTLNNYLNSKSSILLSNHGK